MSLPSDPSSDKNQTGSVIFIHPDGMSLAHWDAVRLVHAGYEGRLNFDRFSNTAVYRGTIRKQVTATSNAGATIHAFGVKTGKDSFGMDEGKNIISKSGDPYSILISAQKKGIKTALCQSGILVEPGTAAFAAQVKKRAYEDEIARQIIESGVDLIFGGGEKYLLPKGVQGYFGLGERQDQRNLIERAKELGYTVIYDLKNFKNLHSSSKILGIFAHDDTYNDDDPVQIKKKQFYQKSAPTIAQMTQAALEFLQKHNQQFLLIVEEEGTDNFSNKKHTEGFLTAGKRADEALGTALDFVQKNPDTLLLTTSDSNAGGLVILEVQQDQTQLVFYTSPKTDLKKPLVSEGLPFSIQWGSGGLDSHGGIVVKAQGLNAHYVKGLIDNTQIYDLMYRTLFGISKE